MNYKVLIVILLSITLIPSYFYLDDSSDLTPIKLNVRMKTAKEKPRYVNNSTGPTHNTTKNSGNDPKEDKNLTKYVHNTTKPSEPLPPKIKRSYDGPVFSLHSFLSNIIVNNWDFDDLDYRWRVKENRLESASVARRDILCKILGKNSYSYSCRLHEIAEMVDLIWSINPLMVENQFYHKTRYELQRHFISRLKSHGISTMSVEARTKDQEFLITTAGKEPEEVQLTLEHVFNYRENLVNVGVRKLDPEQWEYILWIDSHEVFENNMWWYDAVWKMEKYASVHLAQYGVSLSESNYTYQHTFFQTLTYHHTLKTEMTNDPLFYGNAWGIRKEVYNQVEYIYDQCLAGACDGVWIWPALKLIPDRSNFLHEFPCLEENVKEWMANAEPYLSRKYGFVRGLFKHLKHEQSWVYQKIVLWNKICPNIKTDLYRDKNFTLHTNREDIAKALGV